ncbi:OmpA family protein [Lichenicola sp.]|uniref:OmpA family protein n=1 Tax=Lichenicola sp. TaxID=2804529 RepID=UPI003B00B584
MNSRSLLLASLSVVFGPVMAHAQPITGPYVHLGGGVDFLQNENVKDSGFGPAPRHYAFDPGGAASGAVGYGLGNGLRFEVEGSYSYNQAHGVELAPQYLPLRTTGHEQQYGGFGNVLYDFNLGLPVTPYLGLGAGYREVELDHVNSISYSERPGHLPAEARGNFAYQGIAGAAIATPVRGLALTLEYRLIGVDSPGAYYRGLARNPDTGTEQAEHSTFNNIFNHEILVGLRYSFDNPPPPPARMAPEPVAVPAPAPARSYLVFFDWDSAALTSRAAGVVEEAARNAEHVQTTTLEVDGYADTSHELPGDRGRDYNRRLSLRRADSVRAALIRDGVPASAIGVHGYGETNPLVPTGPNAREPQNRRVEIVFR